MDPWFFFMYILVLEKVIETTMTSATTNIAKNLVWFLSTLIIAYLGQDFFLEAKQKVFEIFTFL